MVATATALAPSSAVDSTGSLDSAEDGRRRRRDRNRDAVVDALLELFLDGSLAPSSDEIAERSGLSSRSLFRYFDDIDDLCRAAISRQHHRVLPVLGIGVAADAPAAARISGLVAQRVRLFDTMGPVGVVARVRAPFQPLIATELRQARSFLRHQIQQLFAAELTAAGAAQAARMLAVADVLCSFEAYQLLRHDQHLSRARAGAAIADGLAHVFVVDAS